jgi:L-seryl-tRNA(Ser) seleniumtransferase
MSTTPNDLLRGLPSVSSLLGHEEVQGWLAGLPRSVVVRALQMAVDEVRQTVLDGTCQELPDANDLLTRAESIVLAQTMPSLRRVINATGIVIHTGLGRAPLCAAALEAIVEGASGYCNLEFKLDTGTRGRRQDHVSELLAQMTGAEAATVVNNNAAATLLILSTFARGREAIVSRGQLVEIGGSYRLPDVMTASGTTLREVGTTNRTRLADYERAISEQTAMLLRVHTSNYKIVGFTEEVEIGPLAELAHRHQKLAVDDLGSGALIDLSQYGLPAEPTVQASLAAGADLACASGDKLLGGPQCGIIVGRRDLIQQIERNPLARTYRVDKLTLLALDATLRHYADEEDALASIPTLTLLNLSTEELADRSRELCTRLMEALPEEHFYVGSDVTYAGGGSLPGQELQTMVVRWRPPAGTASRLATALRMGDVPVVARMREDAIFFDVRTIHPDEFEEVVAAVVTALMEFEADVSDDNDDDVTARDGDTPLPLL